MSKDEAVRTGHARYFLANAETKDSNVTIDGQNFFDQREENYIRTDWNIQKIVADQQVDYRNDCFLDYPYFKEHYKLIAIDLSNEQALHADTKTTE